jgi:hypothetical protein
MILASSAKVCSGLVSFVLSSSPGIADTRLLWIGCEERVIGGFEADLWGELGLRATVPAVLQYSRVLFTPRFWRQLWLEGRRERRSWGFAHGRRERRVSV